MGLFGRSTRKKVVITINEMIDEIPDSAEYLYSKEFTYALEETEEDKTKRIIDGGDTGEPEMGVLVQHVYEVDTEDFAKMVKSGFLEKQPRTKMKDFEKKYNYKWPGL